MALFLKKIFFNNYIQSGTWLRSFKTEILILKPANHPDYDYTYRAIVHEKLFLLYKNRLFLGIFKSFERAFGQILSHLNHLSTGHRVEKWKKS